MYCASYIYKKSLESFVETVKLLRIISMKLVDVQFQIILLPSGSTAVRASELILLSTLVLYVPVQSRFLTVTLSTLGTHKFEIEIHICETIWNQRILNNDLKIVDTVAISAIIALSIKILRQFVIRIILIRSIKNVANSFGYVV